MASINQRPTPFPEVNQVLLDLFDRVDDALGDQVFGMYLYGSLATGGFLPSRSDIDFAVITVGYLQASRVESLDSMHMAFLQEGNSWVKKLEGAYVPTAVIKKHDPGHLPVPTLNEGKFYLAQLGCDWIIQRKILKESHSAVSGPSLYEFIDPVEADDLKCAILEVIDQWWEPMLGEPSRLKDSGYQPYAVLSLCRALYIMATDELASKERAATWVKDSLAPEWSDLIDSAAGWADGDDVESMEGTMEFMKFALERCKESRFSAP